MSDLAKMLPAAHKIKNTFDAIIIGANVRNSDEARVSAALCLTILEQYAAVLHLIECKLSSHAPIVVRTMLEGLVNLHNLVSDPTYLNQMKFDDAYNSSVFFEKFAHNPYVKDDKEYIASFAAWKADGQSLLADLKAKGLKKQLIFEKFENAKSLSNCNIAYHVLCAYAHNQLTALTSRHAGDSCMRYHDDAPVENIAYIIGIALEILWLAVETLPKYTDINEDELKLRVNNACEIWGVNRSLNLEAPD